MSDEFKTIVIPLELQELFYGQAKRIDELEKKLAEAVELLGRTNALLRFHLKRFFVEGQIKVNDNFLDNNEKGAQGEN